MNMIDIDYAAFRRLDLNLLVAFDALVSEASVSRAAARLYVGQPAMSHALARLRETFGDDILFREGGDAADAPGPGVGGGRQAGARRHPAAGPWCPHTNDSQYRIKITCLPRNIPQ